MALKSSYTYHAQSLIQEGKEEYIKHDQLFKELINHFFSEFLEVFFPEVHANIDFTSMKPLSEELYTNILRGENRRLDIAIEVKLKGQDTLIIVHIEPQSSYQKDFNHRMYRYFSMLYKKVILQSVGEVYPPLIVSITIRAFTGSLTPTYSLHL